MCTVRSPGPVAELQHTMLEPFPHCCLQEVKLEQVGQLLSPCSPEDNDSRSSHSQQRAFAAVTPALSSQRKLQTYIIQLNIELRVINKLDFAFSLFVDFKYKAGHGGSKVLITS